MTKKKSDRWEKSPQTTTERQDKRKAALQQAAERAGFKSWSAMLTAIKNGTAQVTKIPQS